MERLFARPARPARKVFERVRFSMGCFTDEEATLTMRPHDSPSRMWGRTSRTHRIRLSRICSNAVCQAPSSRSSKVPAGGPPVLLTSTSTPPKCSAAWETRASMSAPFVRSAAR